MLFVLPVVDQEPGQFYDLRIVTNFDWQPKLSFRAKESIAAYRDIKHEELFEDAATGLQALFAGTETLLHSLVGGSAAGTSSSSGSGGGSGGVASSNGGGSTVGAGFSDKLHHRQLMVLAGKCSDTINSLRRSNIREARIWFRGRTAMLSDALQWLPRRQGRLPASYLQFLRQAKVSSKGDATPAASSSSSSSAPTSTAALSASVVSTSSAAGADSAVAAPAAVSSKPPEKKWSYQFYILDAISVR